MKQVIAIRNVAFEDLGYFEQVFQSQGFAIAYFDAGKDDLSQIEQIDPDVLVICGGPISVNDEALYPFLLDELRLVKDRIVRKRATLGLCLGAQVIAKALHAKVYAAGHKEIGWSPLQLSEKGSESPLKHLHSDLTYVFHWHGETFDLPLGAVHLASTPSCLNQGFSYENHMLALQFHPEVTSLGLEQWYIGHSCELSHTPSVSLKQLRLEAQKEADRLRKQGAKMLQHWLNQTLSLI